MKTPYTPHPNLSKEINDALAEQEMLGGVWVTKPTGAAVQDEPYLATGKKLYVQTQNTMYVIEKRGEDEFWIHGNQKYCPVPTKCHIIGSNYGGSMLRMSYIGRGMYMEFMLDIDPEERKRGLVDGHGVITTSQIQEIIEL